MKAKAAILRLFKWLNPEIILTVGGQRLQFKPAWDKPRHVENISEILLKLDEAAGAVNKKLVVVMDEFQQLNEITEHAIEAAIRYAMQYSKRVSYIFSGSHRYLLLSMFNDKNKSFYNSCETMEISRISEEDYQIFIQKAAQEKWGKPLSTLALEKILILTELHPSYVNRVCGYFWMTNQMPTEKLIDQYWLEFIQSKRTEFSEDLIRFSKNQRRVIVYFAKHPSVHPSNHQVCQAVGLSEASVRQAVQVLLKKDYLYKDNTGLIKVLDPALKTYINRLYEN